MFSYEAPSTSMVALHHCDEELKNGNTSMLQRLAIVTSKAVEELEVQAELTIEEIAQHFGIHHFGIHIMAKSLSNCKIILTDDTHIEIHRENQRHPTRFRVERKEIQIQ